MPHKGKVCVMIAIIVVALLGSVLVWGGFSAMMALDNKTFEAQVAVVTGIRNAFSGTRDSITRIPSLSKVARSIRHAKRMKVVTSILEAHEKSIAELFLGDKIKGAVSRADELSRINKFTTEVLDFYSAWVLKDELEADPFLACTIRGLKYFG